MLREGSELRIEQGFNKMDYKFAGLLFALAGLSSNALAQSCPNGIPAAGNPSCIPPSVSGSVYYGGRGVAAPSAAASGRWISTWGAIARDFDTSAVGGVVGRASKRDASSEAVGRCKGYGGKKCEVILAFRNQCGALAWPKTGDSATAGGSTLAEANERALSACQSRGSPGCAVVLSGCSDPYYLPN